MTRPRLSACVAACLALLAGCTPTPPPAPSGAVCGALRPALPTWSPQDTAQSKEDAARFLEVWKAVCG